MLNKNITREHLKKQIAKKYQQFQRVQKRLKINENVKIYQKSQKVPKILKKFQTFFKKIFKK